MANRILSGLLMILIVSNLLRGPALAQDSDPQPQRASSHMFVSTPDDVVARDEQLSLREALMLAEGSLILEHLDSAERGQIIGVPGPNSTDLIKFDKKVFPRFNGPPIHLQGGPLPPLSYSFDSVDARFAGVTLVGGQTQGPGLLVTSDKNLILGVTMVGFSGEAIAIIDGQDNQIRDVQLYNNGVGVYIAGYFARDNRVRNSDLAHNREVNVWIDHGADGNYVEYSALKHSTAGLRFGPGTDHSIAVGNYISYNDYGVVVEPGAGYNHFDDNRFLGNRVDVKYP
jgi:nitrous oxidase accessory protein NosD